MSLQQAAQHLAAQGRGKDTTLVHMTPNEVRGLQQIAMAAGGSLTLNPSTGLPEAGFLDDMMPMIIGAGLIAATGGAAAPAIMGMSAPAAIGLGVGGVQALRTGNLMEGVKAGLGAYGGAGLATGLIGAGAANTAGTAGAFGGSAAGDAAVAGGNAAAGAPSFTTNLSNNLSNMGEGVKGLGTSQGWSNLAANTPGGAMGVAKSGLAGLAPMMMAEPEAPPPTAPDRDMGQRYAYNATPTTPSPQPDVPRAGSPEQFQSFGKEQRFFTPSYTKINADQAKSLYGYAEGGGVDFKYDPSTQQFETAGQNPEPQGHADGGLSHAYAGGGYNLGDYSDGGRLLRGPGDGVSDSIPAVIGKKQPARLADGEFVVPARIVSELGNGSTEAGARKLYAMMDRIQSARGKTVGKGKVAKNSRSDRFLPA